MDEQQFKANLPIKYFFEETSIFEKSSQGLCGWMIKTFMITPFYIKFHKAAVFAQNN